ncbi:hypothetical protein POM88_051844 [Heracleum sosnowskyi]|uniref:ATP-dependent DNA helicase n=1 Tax=Heracleum sosnowskyi TaxID=360622 RepID=A0AAD8LZ13_9APIA|nr:hypothetical protein POM88_051844 [Heracleum sosnowskyi]
MKKHLPQIHEDPSTASSSSIPGNGSLLLNVFNYDLGMMKVKMISEPRITPVSDRLLNYDCGMMEEDVAPSNTVPPLSEDSFLDENISFAKRTRREEFLHSPCANVSKCLLLFNVFNYDVSTMKEKEGLMKENYKPRINKENVDPQQQIPAQKTTPQTGKCFSPWTPLSNVSNETRKRFSPRTPLSNVSNETTKRFSPRTPLSNVSSICDSSSCLQKEIWELNRPKKRLDTPLCTPTSIFHSNIKECTLGQNRGLLNTAQILDFDMGTDFAQSHRTIDEIDYSRIVGFDIQEPDFYSDEEDVEDVNSRSYDNERKGGKDAVAIEYASLGAPNVQCDKCQACMWKEERTNKNVKRGRPGFSLCCAKGQIQLPKEKPTPSYLWQLYNDSKKGPRFKEGIRLYNSLFAFTSTGGRVDHSINCGGAPYIYRLNGQNHHLFGSLIPDGGQDPKFCQLYIYDTENEVKNRMKWINVRDGTTVHAEIVEALMKMLDEKNELVKEFRTQRDRFKEGEVTDLEITLKVSRADDGRENHVGPSDEIAGIMVGDLDDNCGFRDIVIHSYEDGNKSSRKRALISQKEYYSYKFQVRRNEGMTPRLGGRLFQQYMVDAFSTIEQAHDIKKKSFFGKCLGVMYVVEFQKRGLPHVHMLLWHFPKKYSPSTTFDESGFPMYKRRNNAITRSRLWKTVKLNQLIHNMRINKGKNEFEVKRMKAFAQWVLDIGDGKIDRALKGDEEEDITIPSEFCNLGNVNSLDDMIDSTFPDLIENYKDPKYLSERAILTPRNNTVSHVNALIVEKIPGDSFSYFSVDSAEEFPGTTIVMESLYNLN